jgi:hypothetical protein
VAVALLLEALLLPRGAAVGSLVVVVVLLAGVAAAVVAVAILSTLNSNIFTTSPLPTMATTTTL